MPSERFIFTNGFLSGPKQRKWLTAGSNSAATDGSVINIEKWLTINKDSHVPATRLPTTDRFSPVVGTPGQHSHPNGPHVLFPLGKHTHTHTTGRSVYFLLILPGLLLSPYPRLPCYPLLRYLEPLCYHRTPTAIIATTISWPAFLGIRRFTAYTLVTKCKPSLRWYVVLLRESLA